MATENAKEPPIAWSKPARQPDPLPERCVSRPQVARRRPQCSSLTDAQNCALTLKEQTGEPASFPPPRSTTIPFRHIPSQRKPHLRPCRPRRNHHRPPLIAHPAPHPQPPTPPHNCCQFFFPPPLIGVSSFCHPIYSVSVLFFARQSTPLRFFDSTESCPSPHPRAPTRVPSKEIAPVQALAAFRRSATGTQLVFPPRLEPGRYHSEERNRDAASFPTTSRAGPVSQREQQLQGLAQRHRPEPEVKDELHHQDDEPRRNSSPVQAVATPALPEVACEGENEQQETESDEFGVEVGCTIAPRDGGDRAPDVNQSGGVAREKVQRSKCGYEE